jgi:hypothetical protein
VNRQPPAAYRSNRPRAVGNARRYLSVRWYPGYDLEPLPDHSSMTRIRDRYGITIFRIEHKETGSIGAFHANTPRELERVIEGGGWLDAHTASRSGVVTRLLVVLQTAGRRQG